MRFVQLILLYFCTVVCTLYLVSGGYKVIRNYIRKRLMPRRRKNQRQPVSRNKTRRASHFVATFLTTPFNEKIPCQK